MSREKKKVIAAGHICIDITPIFPQEKVEHIGDILKPGRLIEMDNVSVNTEAQEVWNKLCSFDDDEYNQNVWVFGEAENTEE